VKYAEPQAGHDRIGMFSMTNKLAPLPKLRVACVTCTRLLPHDSQVVSTEVDRDDDELARVTDFDDRFGAEPVERVSIDDVLAFADERVTLPFADFSREDDVFKVKTVRLSSSSSSAA
jgi:hypothetical protein